tara:strand:+ start:911 stop:1084 length:174 start_codon:yes stop_codon:yes gene_type:complete
MKSYYQLRIDQLESDLCKIRTMQEEENARSKEYRDKARLCKIELNNYQEAVDRINEN